MRHSASRRLGSVAIVALLALSACDSAEQRAQTHYERGVSLVESGETDRAALEFRNALQSDGNHLPALRAYADLLRDTGDNQGAIRTYMRVATVDPEDAPAHLALAELSLALQDFASVETFSERAYELDPEAVDIRAMHATVLFRRGEVEEAAGLAEGVLAEQPSSVPAHMVLLAERMAAEDFEAAVERADMALELAPQDQDLHLSRLAALDQLGDVEQVGDQLRRMAETFPEDGSILQALVQWHDNQGEHDAAIAVLRRIADRSPEEAGGYLNLAQYIFQVQGGAAARAELEALMASRSEPRPFQRALAQLDFAEGRRDQAIAGLRRLIADDEPSAERRALQLALAQMLIDTGADEEARSIVEEVLSEDDRNVGALKLRAGWRIESDQTDLALADLRHAATEAPRDPEIMTLMARAHDREGARELVGERLARAVEASSLGAAESLRYARFLMSDGRAAQAEGVVVDALRRAPENPELLLVLGQVHIQREDFARAQQVVGILRGIDSQRARDMAAGLEIAALQAQDRLDDTIEMLSRLAAEGEGDLRPRIGLVQTRIAAGDHAGARSEVEALLADDPESVAGRMMLAGIHVVEGEAEEAEALYRGVIAEWPDVHEPYLILVSLLNGTGREDEARHLLAEGIEATGRSATLLNMRAGMHYLEGDIDAAIADFEELYARNTADVVIANNLASLISTHRDDADSLERAFQVGRRLRGTDVPHFQDTYGWILVRRGDSEQALGYLEPAAAALESDPLVQYHLGIAYYSLERWDEARAALQRAVDVAGERADDLPQIATARERIAEIEARPAEELDG